MPYIDRKVLDILGICLDLQPTNLMAKFLPPSMTNSLRRPCGVQENVSRITHDGQIKTPLHVLLLL